MGTPSSPPTPSATLILIRRCPGGVEIYLLRRSRASKFMPGTYVFPGGSLEIEDMDAAFWQSHVDLSGDQLDRALDGEIERMLPFAVAAIRETWEEAGLLLAATMQKVVRRQPCQCGSTPFLGLIQAKGDGCR